MRLAGLIPCLAIGALALAPRSTTADDAVMLALLADDAPGVSLEGGVAGGSSADLSALFTAAPFIGVERSTAFRLDARRRLLRGEPEPLTFADQAASGLAVFHLTAYADPDPGRYARGGNNAALSQAGLKVVDPEAADEDALCATLMTCLVALDSVSRQNDSGAPIVVIVDARPAPHPEPLLLRVAYALIADAPSSPTWTEIFSEIATAIPDADPERLAIVVTGGAGEMPDPTEMLGRTADAVYVDGDHARVFRGDAAPAAIQEAEMSGALTVVIGADWSGEGDPARLSPKEAASLGAHVVVVTPETARMGGG